MTTPVRIRMTKLDRAYEECRAAISEALAEPEPGDTKRVPIGFLEPKRFNEEVILPLTQDCLVELLPPPNVLMFEYRYRLLKALQAEGLPITRLGPSIVDSLLTAVQACLESRLLNKKELMSSYAIREREREYRMAVYACLMPVIKIMYDLAAEYGYAHAQGELEVGP
jgi:hypothetical protein